MELCNICGIVYDEKECPLCTSKNEINELENEIEALTQELELLREELKGE